MMIPVTLPHAPPTITPPLYHHTPPSNNLPSPQNHLPSPEYHLCQNSFQTHAQQQNLLPMEKLTFFLQKLTENQAKHQQEVFQFLNSVIPVLSNQQVPPSSVQAGGDNAASAFSAENAEKLHLCSQNPMQCVPAVETTAQPTTQVLNTFLRSSMPAATVSAHSGSFSPSNGSFQGHFSCRNGSSAENTRRISSQDNNDFSFNLQAQNPLSSVINSQHLNVDVNSGIPELNHHENHPTVSIQQNSILPTGQPDLSVQLSVAETVLPAFSALSAPATSEASAAQGSRSHFIQSNTPTDSQPQFLTSPQPTSSPPTKSFANLLKNSDSISPTILAPIPSPYIKGNLPAKEDNIPQNEAPITSAGKE